MKQTKNDQKILKKYTRIHIALGLRQTGNGTNRQSLNEKQSQSKL